MSLSLTFYHLISILFFSRCLRTALVSPVPSVFRSAPECWCRLLPSRHRSSGSVSRSKNHRWKWPTKQECPDSPWTRCPGPRAKFSSTWSLVLSAGSAVQLTQNLPLKPELQSLAITGHIAAARPEEDDKAMIKEPERQDFVFLIAKLCAIYRCER